MKKIKQGRFFFLFLHRNDDPRALAHHATNLRDAFRHRGPTIAPVICTNGQGQRNQKPRNRAKLGIEARTYIRRRKSTTSTLRRISRFPGDAGTVQPAALAEAPMATPTRRRFAASRPAPVSARSLFGGAMAPTDPSSLGLWL